jgi:integrase
MNLRFLNGHFYIWHSRKEWPPAGKLVAIETILGSKITDQTAAEKFLKTYKAERSNLALSNVFSISSQARKTRLSDLQDKFTKGERADLSPATLRLDKLSIQKLIDAAGDKPISSVTHADLVDLKTAALAANLSPNTICAYFSHLKAALSWAKNQGLAPAVPVFPKVKTPDHLPGTILAKHLKAILAYAKKNDYETWRYAQFSLNTGCRINEAKALQHQHITIFPKPTAAGIMGRARLTGKGDKQRIIPLLPDAAKAIGKSKKTATGPVFKQWLTTTTSKKFKECVRQAAEKFPGLKDDFEKYHFHSLRHTAATNMLEKGIKLETIQKILGHVDISTTQIYARVLDQFLEEEMGKMINS